MSKFDPRPRLPIDESNPQYLILLLDKSLEFFSQNSLSKQREMIYYEFQKSDYVKRVNQYKFLSQTRPKMIKLSSNILFLREYDDLIGEQHFTFTMNLQKSFSNQMSSLKDQQERTYQFLKELDTNLLKLKYLFLTNEESNIVIDDTIAQYSSSIRKTLGKNPYYFQKIQLDIIQIILETIYDRQVKTIELMIVSPSTEGNSNISQSGSHRNRKNKSRVPRQQRQRNGGSDQNSNQSSSSKVSQCVSNESLFDNFYSSHIAFSRAQFIDFETFTRKIQYTYEAKGYGDQFIAQKIRKLNIRREIENVKHVWSLPDLQYMVKYIFQQKQLSGISSGTNIAEKETKHYFSYYCEKGNTLFNFFSKSRQILTKVAKKQIYDFIMSIFLGIKELQKHGIIHPDLQLPNFIKIDQSYQIIDYKKIICFRGNQHMKNIYRKIFKLLLRSQNFQALREECNEMVNDPQYENIYNQYQKQRRYMQSRLNSQSEERILMSRSMNFIQINNPQINEQTIAQQQAMNSFFKVLYSKMQLKHYSQFYSLVVDKLLKPGMNRTGFPLSKNQIQRIVQLFPALEDVVRNGSPIDKFKNDFKVRLQEIQTKFVNEPRINRKQIRQQQFLKHMSHESIHEQTHKNNLIDKADLILAQLGKQFIDQYCYIQKQQSAEGALPAGYKIIEYISLFQSAQQTYRYIISVVDILYQLQKKGLMQLHADEKTFIFDGTKYRLATLQFVYKIKKISKSMEQEQLQNEGMTNSYNTIRHAILLLNSGSKRPFMSLAEKIKQQKNFNFQAFVKIGRQNLRFMHAKVIYRIFNLIFCLAVNQQKRQGGIRESNSNILQGSEQNCQKLKDIKAVIQICTQKNPNDCYDIKKRIQAIKVFQSVNNI